MRNPSPPTQWIIQGPGIRLGIEELNQRLQLSVRLSAAPSAVVASSLAQRRFFIGSWIVRAEADFGELCELWDVLRIVFGSPTCGVSPHPSVWTLCAAQAAAEALPSFYFSLNPLFWFMLHFSPHPVTSFACKPSLGIFANYYGFLNNI